MAQITIPIKIDILYVLLDTLRNIETDEEDYTFRVGFYYCKYIIISAIENFIAKHTNN